MKSLKTYNLDLDVIQILRRQANKSQYVCKAVRRYHSGQSEFEIDELTLDELMLELSSRLELGTTEWNAFVVLSKILTSS